NAREAEARNLLQRCIAWIDDYHIPKLGGVFALRVKAEALLRLGDTEHALDTLQAAFAADDYQQWWDTLERDAHWPPLRDDPRVASIHASVERHIEVERAKVAELRANGSLPRRSIPAVTGAVAGA